MSNEAVTITLDEVSFQLKEEHDFDWLARLGKVFAVFDQQDSGNLSFGVEQDGRRYFVKYAGAQTVQIQHTPQAAIQLLQDAVSLYTELAHPQLIHLVEYGPVGQGYMALFDWFEGEGLHPHETYPPPAKYEHPDSPFYRFRQLPVEQRLQALDDIFDFHVQVEQRGYVAIDFYDGSLLYDFTRSEIKICDIDVYHKKPYVNRMGRMWGSSRFMSPEEHLLGAVIDGRTNVYNMGAMAFCLVGGERDRSLAKWEAGEALFEIVSKAVQDDRQNRFASVEEFHQAWQARRKDNG